MELSTVLVVVLLTFLAGLTCGVIAAWGWARAKAQVEMIETYKHLLDYGRTEKPQAVVSDRPSTVEEMAQVRISETARGNLSSYIAAEAGVSETRAREEAEKLMSQVESWSQGPG